MLLSILLACTEVGLVKYTNNPADTNATVVDTSGTAVEPASQPDTQPSTGPEGVGGYFNYYVRQVACPACVGEPQGISIDLLAKFHDPTNQTHTEWIPQQGECTNTLTFTSPSIALKDVGASILMRNINREIIMPKSGQEYKTQIYETQYDRDTEHDVVTDIGDFKFESFHGFDSIEPETMLFVDPSYAFAAPIYRSGATFWWQPSGTTSTFLITLAIYTPDGSSLLGYVSCAGADTGQMTVPGTYLSSYPQGGLVAVHLARHKIEKVLFEAQNTFIETHMEHEVVGTGMVQ